YVLSLEPLHDVDGEQVARAVLDAGRMAAPEVGDGVDEELERDRWPALVACDLGDDRREVAARAVATDRDAVAVAAEAVRVVGDPVQRGSGVDDRRGELVLGREAVVDADDDDMPEVREHSALVIVRVEVEDREAAA